VGRGQWLLLGGLAIAAVGVWAVLLGQILAPGPPSPSPEFADAPSATPSSTATVAPTAAASGPPSAAVPSPTASPPPEAEASPEPPAGGEPEPLAGWLTFLDRMNGARTAAQTLNGDLRDAGEAQDLDAVRRTAADMADLVATERAWLGANPPADCYADAHAAADDLLAAYGEVATEATRWADTSGLAALSALADLYVAVEDATAAAAAAGQSLEAAACP
jgi:hypothetical protein